MTSPYSLCTLCLRKRILVWTAGRTYNAASKSLPPLSRPLTSASHPHTVALRSKSRETKRRFISISSVRDPGEQPPAKPATPTAQPTPLNGGKLDASIAKDQTGKDVKFLFEADRKDYEMYRMSDAMLKLCSAQAEYELHPDESGKIPANEDGEQVGTGSTWWHKDMDLTPSFATWMHVTFLHMWMLHARMRRLPVDISKQIQNELKNHFFYVAEERMKALHKLTSSDLRTKYLRDFFEQWQGAVFSYDEGLIRGDAILATALWTSIFKSDDRSPVENVTTVVEYVRSTLQYLDGLSDADFLNIKKFPHAKAAPSIESATPVLEKVAVDT